MKAKRAILVVEDDAAIRLGIVDALESEGYAVEEAARGDDGAELAVRGDFDLVLLDLVLPGIDGLAVLERVRATRPRLPVIVLTALGAEHDRVKGLKLGADDYVVKPFSAKELLARVEAVLRRSAERPHDLARICFPGGAMDVERRELSFEDGERCPLSEKEAEFLLYLARNPARAVSRDELLKNVWRVDPAGVETRTIDVLVARLRQKLRDDPEQPAVLRTVRGVGYMFAAQDRPGRR